MAPFWKNDGNLISGWHGRALLNVAAGLIDGSLSIIDILEIESFNPVSSFSSIFLVPSTTCSWSSKFKVKLSDDEDEENRECFSVILDDFDGVSFQKSNIVVIFRINNFKFFSN